MKIEKNIPILIFKTFIDVYLELFSVERAGARHYSTCKKYLRRVFLPDENYFER